ncbi:MAG TPA: acyltransferase [Acidisphaera sp.]|nr:acyltransferase [Acidisphaera sp.]
MSAAAQVVQAPAAAALHPRALPLVQVLRAVAALSVAFLHITQQAGVFVGRPGEPAYGWLRPLPWDAGVDVFFVISGFVMVWSSMRLFGRRDAARLFLGRRIARIVPLYWAMTSLLVAVALVSPHAISDGLESIRYVVASYLFIPVQRPDGFIQPVFRLGWTLNYEMLFYAIFALFIRLQARVAVPWVVATIVVLAGIGRVLRPASPALAFWTDPIVLEFAFGVLLATLALSGARLTPAPRLLLVFAALALLVVSDRLPELPRGLAYGVPCTLLMAAAVLAPVRPIRSRWTEFWVLLGDASYALYLVHPFPMRAFEIVWLRLGWTGPAAVLAYIASAVVATIVAAFALHRWLERPATAATRRLLHA